MNDPTPLGRRSIEDNYPEYLEHEYGYAYEVADVMSQAALARHEELLHLDAGALEQVNLEDLDDFQLWAVARAWRRLGEFERFVELSRRLIDSDDEHPVVIYSEISRWLARELTGHERTEEAQQILAEHLERWPSDTQARALAGLVAYVASDDDARLQTLVDDYPDDAELHFEIAEDLWRFGRGEAASKWLEQADKAAERSQDASVRVDIELLADRIAQASELQE